MTNTQTTIPMDFTNAKPTTSADWLWSSVFYKGERGTVVNYYTDDYGDLPMLRVLFADGRQAILKISELGA